MCIIAKPQTRPKLARKDSEQWISMRELTNIRPSFVTNVWKVVLAVSALLDFLSVYLPMLFLRDVDEYEEAEKKAENVFLFWKRDLATVEEEKNWYLNLAKWFDANAILLNVIFCLLYLVDAFIQAYRRRIIVLRDRDRKRLLEGDSKKSVIKTKDVQESGDDNNAWDDGSWNLYIKFVFLQVILLPVGFFLLVIHYGRSIITNEEVHLSEEVEAASELIVSASASSDGGILPNFRATIIADPTNSVAMALIVYCLQAVQIVLHTSFKDVIRRFTLRLSRRTAAFAIRNPRKFRRRLILFLTYLRWGKYLGPLIGASNKLKGNVVDLMKKFRQQREAAKAARIRKKIWRKMGDEERKEKAALLIQSRFRANKVQKRARALKILQGDKETIAALRMQKVLKGMLARARARLKKKRLELQKLQAEQRNKALSEDERRRMYELQDDVGVEAKKLLNRKMLMRPNTRFAVTWKIIFVVAVIFEITQLALKPYLAKYKDNTTGKPLDIEHILEHHLVPTRITEWSECSIDIGQNTTIVTKQHPSRVDKILNKFRRKKSEDDSEAPMSSWYCARPFVFVQSIYISLLTFFIFNFLEVTAFICFMDVFITFFTGELSDRGILVPKPFFTRWILPGLFLQLLVNPQMETVSYWVFRGLQNVIFVGVIRFVRWISCFFYPLLFFLYHSWERYVWAPLVHKQNTNHVLKSKMIFDVR